MIATKIGNSTYFEDNGNAFHVTILKVEDCHVTQVKTSDKNGYNSIQLASIETNKDINKINKPNRKIFSKINLNPKKILKEFKVGSENSYKEGEIIQVNHFKKDQFVDISGRTIGKGFAGVMKRHNFGGLRASHGVSISHRSHGSTGQNQDPGRVFKGKKMAGRMGCKNITKQNLRVVDIDDSNKILIVKGSIPGKKNSIVFIKDSVKKSVPKWKKI